MEDKPAAAARKKKDSSMRVACELVAAGEACGVLSAGNSGAFLATALVVFGRMDGVLRPAIGTLLPAQSPFGLVHLVDAGANVECEPEQLAQWAVLATTALHTVHGVAKPTVAVLSNGEEDTKGTALTRATLALLRTLPLEVVGYVEGRDITAGKAHVVVTDGFTGNVTLKTAEGVFRSLSAWIREGYAQGSVLEKVGGALSRSMFARLRSRLDPREFGAAPFLGLDRPAFVAHGSSDAYAIRRGIGAVRAWAQHDVAAHMRAAIARTLPLLARMGGALPSGGADPARTSSGAQSD